MNASRWWHRRTLHARLSLLVTAAVGVAVIAVAILALAAVAEVQHHQQDAQLQADAQAIAAQPDRWRSAGRSADRGIGDGDGDADDPHGPRDLGPRWQILDASGTVISQSTSSLPVTDRARQVAAGGPHPAREQVTIGDDTYAMLTVPAAGGGAVQVAVSKDPATRTLTIFGVLLAAGCLLGIGAAALLGRTVARAGLVPVQQLTDAVEQVAVTTDLNHPIPVHGVDEIARLGVAVNTMLSAIDSARQAQRTLVEDAGHELRTPLTSIRTNIELLLEVERHPDLAHRLPPEERTQLLRDLAAQVAELATLTTELVELSREEATREQPEDLDFADVVTAAVTRARTRAPGLAFSTDLAAAIVRGRPAELERMVVNVLDNAAKWSPSDATVHIRLTADRPGWCELTVSDTGPGIDEADRPHVFDRFYRAPAARSMPGSGLGLAIVAQTAAQHGGTVEARANCPQGTVITIRLPLVGVSGRRPESSGGRTRWES